MDSFPPVAMSKDEKDFWLKFRRKLKRLNEQIEWEKSFQNYKPESFFTYKIEFKFYRFFTALFSKYDIKRNDIWK